MDIAASTMAHPLAYGAALAVHVATALVSFATLALSGLYGSWGRRLGTPQQVRDVRNYFARPNRAGQTLWAVPVSGGIAVWLSHGAGALGQAWVVAATACWAVATVLAVRLIWPAERRVRPIAARLDEAMLADAGHPTRIELAALCRPIVRAAPFCNLAFTVALVLMVLQPK